MLSTLFYSVSNPWSCIISSWPIRRSTVVQLWPQDHTLNHGFRRHFPIISNGFLIWWMPRPQYVRSIRTYPVTAIQVYMQSAIPVCSLVFIYSYPLNNLTDNTLLAGQDKILIDHKSIK